VSQAGAGTRRDKSSARHVATARSLKSHHRAPARAWRRSTQNRRTNTHRSLRSTSAPGFQFVVTEASLREVVVRDRPRYTQWVYDVWTRGLSSPRANSRHDQCEGHRLRVRRTDLGWTAGCCKTLSTGAATPFWRWSADCQPLQSSSGGRLDSEW